MLITATVQLTTMARMSNASRKQVELSREFANNQFKLFRIVFSQ